ncbi:hypothetical protein BJY52DRAFT_1310047 [Lactarius psammicola]|nr:hypothetical protein BJY52DRAFT_1310047 [Lactarius psammicola]
MGKGRTEIKLTGYRLLKILILAFCITMAALAYCGQSSALTTPAWVAGAPSAIISRLPVVSTASIHHIIGLMVLMC